MTDLTPAQQEAIALVHRTADKIIDDIKNSKHAADCTEFEALFHFKLTKVELSDKNYFRDHWGHKHPVAVTHSLFQPGYVR